VVAFGVAADVGPVPAWQAVRAARSVMAVRASRAFVMSSSPR
jgi:hypothetical protein